jgi:hypothetical protein
MPSLQNKFSPSNWNSYPTETEWLSGFRLILPIASGIYGMPGNQVALTSNHQSYLAHFANVDGMTTFMLDGGGFPVEVASAFGLLTPPQASDFQEYVKFMGGDVAFYIPPSLSVAWGWKDGDARLGGIIRVDARIFPNSRIQKLPPLAVRLYSAARLALAQLLLLLFSIAIINIQAFASVAVFLLLGSALIAALWDHLPKSGWMKGGSVGFACAASAVALNFFQFFSFSPLFVSGIFLTILWMGGLLMGARSAS